MNLERLQEAGELLQKKRMMTLGQVISHFRGEKVRPTMDAGELREAREVARDKVCALVWEGKPVKDAARVVFAEGGTGYATANVLYCVVYKKLQRAGGSQAMAAQG